MMIRTITLLFLGGTVLSGCVTGLEKADHSPLNSPMIGAPKDNLRLGAEPLARPEDLRVSIYNPEKDKAGMTQLRTAALKEAAQSYGSQSGYARRSWEISNRLEVRSSDLSTVFDFNRVVSTAPVKAGVVIPPVVSRSFDAYVINNEGREASVAGEYLTIVAPGRLAPLAPTWRDYLIFAAPEPKQPNKTLLPSDQAEMAAFNQFVKSGWKAGVELADAEFEERVNRLKRDYQGMLQYRRLVAMGMMDRMVLADADFGVTKDGQEMRIDSRTVEIVSDAAFQSNPSKWKVRAVSQRDALIVDAGEIPAISNARR